MKHDADLLKYFSEDGVKNALIRRAAQQLEDHQKQKETTLQDDKWSDPDFLKSLSRDEINQNWDKVSEGLSKLK